MWKTLFKDDCGAAAIEYGLIAAIIAVSAALAVSAAVRMLVPADNSCELVEVD
jgi:Flp pilus assembly pilin Flp